MTAVQLRARLEAAHLRVGRRLAVVRNVVRVAVLALGAAVTFVCAVAALTGRVPLWVLAVAVVLLVWVSRSAGKRARRKGHAREAVDALIAVRDEGARAGGGAFVGIDEAYGGILHVPAECAALILGPPRVGKTTSVVIPSVLSAPGAVVSTSTKPDVLLATARARSRYGTVWAFDPTGQATDLPAGVMALRWSPLSAAGEWGSARRIAAAMVGASPAAKGTKHESHWTSRAAALLGPFLYAAALGEQDMRAVVGWVLAGDKDLGEPGRILKKHAAWGNTSAELALEVLEGVHRAADQERQSIWSATADVIDVYTTSEALDAASRPNWDPAQFVRSADTVYIAASAEHQAGCAPLVVALIEAVRDAQYARHRADALAGRRTWPPVTLVLDEVANVAPIASLPALVSEAGGQGLHVVAAVQDLSQVRGRWGNDVAEGFLSLFQHVLVLGGIRDTRTLEAISTICGEWLRPQETQSHSISYSRKPWELKFRPEISNNWSSTSSLTRERQVYPGDVYALEHGRAIYLYGSEWRHVILTPHYSHRRWTAALAAAPADIVTWPRPPLDGRRGHPAFTATAVSEHTINGHVNGHGGNGCPEGDR
ncbi:MAG: type IV secretory system conjugative DNA transfer family protein [Egibacteraceae bacterium]